MRDQLNTIAVYTIQIQSSNNKIKSMGLHRININISKRFGLMGNLRRVNEDNNTVFNLKDIKLPWCTIYTIYGTIYMEFTWHMFYKDRIAVDSTQIINEVRIGISYKVSCIRALQIHNSGVYRWGQQVSCPP